MRDLMQFCFDFRQQDKTFTDGCRYIHLIEASPVLRKIQQETLQNANNNNNNNEWQNTKTKVPCLVFPQERKILGKQQLDRNNTISVYWHNSLVEFRHWQEEHDSKLMTFCVAQEFIDALPVYAFEKTADGSWRERLIDVALQHDLEEEMRTEDEAMSSHHIKVAVSRTTHKENLLPGIGEKESGISAISQLKPRLRIVLAPTVTPALRTLLPVDDEGFYLSQQLNTPDGDSIMNAPTGSVIEVCPEGCLFVQDVASILEKQGGACLVVDYGHEGSTDSIRGFSGQQQVHFLSRPGQVDVTANVDFAALRHAVNNHHSATSTKNPTILAHGPATQGSFLMAMGIQDRVIASIESDSCSEQQAEDLYQALIRLCAPEEMGEKYKVLALCRDSEPPPGF